MLSLLALASGVALLSTLFSMIFKCNRCSKTFTDVGNFAQHNQNAFFCNPDSSIASGHLVVETHNRDNPCKSQLVLRLRLTTTTMITLNHHYPLIWRIQDTTGTMCLAAGTSPQHTNSWASQAYEGGSPLEHIIVCPNAPYLDSIRKRRATSSPGNTSNVAAETVGEANDRIRRDVEALLASQLSGRFIALSHASGDMLPSSHYALGVSSHLCLCILSPINTMYVLSNHHFYFHFSLETVFQDVLNIFRCNPNFAYVPSKPTSRAIINDLLAESNTLPWDIIDLSAKISDVTLENRRQYVLIRSDIPSAFEKLIKQHPIVTEPSEVHHIEDGVSERLIQEFYSGDLHINTTKAVRIHLKNGNIVVVMIKLWSDVTCLGGNDRYPVRLFMVSLGNHPMAFSKSNEGQLCVAMCNDAIKDAGGKLKVCTYARYLGRKSYVVVNMI